MRTRAVRSAFAFAACLFLGSSIASAQATRTWVSGVGDDANPCSRTAPCKTFAGAISKTASGGEIDALDPGGYGGLTITKPITINGTGTLASLLVPAGNAILINTAAGDAVTLRNISIQGVGTGMIGVRVMSASNVVIENVRISGFHTGVLVENGNTVVNHSFLTDNRGVGLNGAGGTLTVESTLLNSNYIAVQATGPGQVRLSDNSIYNNQTGFGCGGGLLISAGNNRKAGNTGAVGTSCSPTMSMSIQ
jgi:hypothetical protein